MVKTGSLLCFNGPMWFATPTFLDGPSFALFLLEGGMQHEAFSLAAGASVPPSSPKSSACHWCESCKHGKPESSTDICDDNVSTILVTDCQAYGQVAGMSQNWNSTQPRLFFGRPLPIIPPWFTPTIPCIQSGLTMRSDALSFLLRQGKFQDGMHSIKVAVYLHSQHPLIATDPFAISSLGIRMAFFLFYEGDPIYDPTKPNTCMHTYA